MQHRHTTYKTLALCKKLGRDIEIARLKRQWTREQLAQRAMISQNTLSKIIAGDGGVSFSRYLSVFVALGVDGKISDLIASKNDELALQLEIERLPKRIRK